MERWRRKLIEKGEMKPPAIIIVPKNGPRGLTKHEMEQGLKASKDKGEPAHIDWSEDDG